MNPISRRAWLKIGMLTGAVLSAPVLQQVARAATSRPPLEPRTGTADLTRSILLAELDTRFVVWRGFARPVGLRLVHVGDASSAVTAGTTGSEDCYSAFFEGAPHALLEQGTYTVSHARLGRLTLFLVPVGRPARAVTYELAVNRVAK